MATRRDFLKEASLLAGGAGIWHSLPPSIQKALAINPEPGTTFLDAEHIVFLMQENRSFDHCFGTLQGVRGFNDPHPITIPGQTPVWIQTNEKGKKYVPFRLNMKDTRATWMGGLPHSWTDQVDARNNGKYDKWLIAKKAGGDYKEMPLTLGYYNREDIPFYYALADAFTICDQNFSSALTGTTPNRLFFWSGTIREASGKQANVWNSDVYYNKEVNWKTYPERLEENGIPWKVYQNEISLQTDLKGDDESWLANFTDNDLEWFSNYNVRFHKAHYDFMMKRIGELPGEIKHLKRNLEGKKQNQAVKIQKILLQKKQQLEKYQSEVKKWSPENFEKLSAFKKNIHKRAFVTNTGDPDYHKTDPFIYEENGIKREFRLPKGDVFYQFRQDVNTGNLPMVSWLVAPQYYSDHPSAPWFGAWYVSQVLEILTRNPKVWKKTIFILNYDENDGYFDHIPPFTAPKPNDSKAGKVSSGIDTTDEYVTMKDQMQRPDLKKENAREDSIGLGYRVPLIIASPWSRGGWVNSQLFDITSTVRFLESFLKAKTGKDIRETNISEWRRTVVGDLTSVFRQYNGEKVILPDFLDRDTFTKEIYNTKFKDPPSDYHALNREQVREISETLFSQLLPGQEKGIRNACALPYEFEVNGNLTSNKRSFKIVFSVNRKHFAEKSAGVPFNVYVPGKYKSPSKWEEVRAWSFAVKAGDKIEYTWPLDRFENGIYHLRVYGPNGFFREFKGSKDDPQIEINLINNYSDGTGKLTGDAKFVIDNIGQQSIDLSLKDNKYGSPSQTIAINEHTPEIQKLVDVKNNSGWYDFSLIAKGSNGFEKRFAGRMESGQPSKTDPFMGRMI